MTPDDSAQTTFDWTTLEEDEEVVWEGKPHVYSLVPAFVIGTLLSVVLIGLVIIAWAWIDRENTEYVVTSKALYKKRGAISRSVKRIDFEKVQNTSLSQGPIGTYLDYGNVEISTAGSEGAEMRFRAVPDPRGVQELVNRRLQRVRGSRDDTAEPGDEPDDVLVEMLEELRAIRRAVVEDTAEASGNPNE